MHSPQPTTAPHAARHVRLLVVEDSVDDYELLLIQLRDAPFKVDAFCVDDESSMRGALNSRPWDLVISDHNLPRFNSREALRLVKDSGFDLPFIIVSGAIGEDAAVEAMLNGADDYVMKHRPGRLIAAIQRALQNATERRERRAAEAAYGEAQRRLNAITANIPGLLLRIESNAATGALSMPYVSGGQICRDPHARSIQNIDDLLAQFGPEGAASLREAIDTASSRRDTALRWEGKIFEPCCVSWVLLSATRDTSDSGRLIWDGMLTDITPEKVALEDLAEAREETSALIAHQEAAKEAERASIAREIHDDIGGLLTGAKTDIVWLKRHLAADATATDRLADMDALLIEVVQSAKRIAKALRPAILDQGLNAAIEWQAREFEDRSGIACRFNTNSEELNLDQGSSTGVFRVFQEALTNVSKHAEATRVDVQLFASESNVTLEVHDNGRGLEEPPLTKSESFGVRGMKERIEQLGGWIEVSGAPGKGTTVMLSVPHKAARDPRKTT